MSAGADPADAVVARRGPGGGEGAAEGAGIGGDEGHEARLIADSADFVDIVKRGLTVPRPWYIIDIG